MTREQCTARRRDKKRCEAQAIEGGSVCRKHGGSAPQVAIAARRKVLLEEMLAAGQAWEKTGGSHGGELNLRQLAALRRVGAAGNALETFEQAAELIRVLQHAARQPALFPDVRADFIRLARTRASLHGCDKVIREQLDRLARRLDVL